MSRHFRCPTCRESFAVPKNGILGFRRDFRFEQVKELVETPEAKAADESRDSGIPCSVCCKHFPRDDRKFCKDCQKTLCGSCQIKHSSVDVFRHHQLQDDTSGEAGADSPDSCSRHNGERTAYVCLDCLRALCVVCVLTSHSGHRIVEWEEGGREEMPREVMLRCQRLEETKSQLSSGLMAIAQSEKSLRFRQIRISQWIQKRMDECLQELYRQERSLLGTLERGCEEELRNLATEKQTRTRLLDRIEQVTADVRTVTSQESTQVNLKKLENVSSNLSGLLQDVGACDYVPRFPSLDFESNPSLPKLGTVNIRPGQTESGSQTPSDVITAHSSALTDVTSRETPSDVTPSGESLLLDDVTPVASATSPPPVETSDPVDYTTPNRPRCSLVFSLGKLGAGGGEFHTPRDVSYLPWGDIVVADTNNDRLQVFDSNGLLVRVLGVGEIKPWGVSCSPSGKVMVADNMSKTVKMFDVHSGELLRQVGAFQSPCGVALNSKGQILVTDFFTPDLYVYDRHGRLRRKVRYRIPSDRHQSGASRLAVAPGDDVIIADVSNGSLKAFDRKGRYLWSVPALTDVLSPQGVCVSRDGVILVADAVQNKLIQFSRSGHCLGPVDIPSDLNDPSGLDVGPDNKRVAVTNLKTNQVTIYKVGFYGNQPRLSVSSSSEE